MGRPEKKDLFYLTSLNRFQLLFTDSFIQCRINMIRDRKIKKGINMSNMCYYVEVEITI